MTIPDSPPPRDRSLMDELLRGGVPEIKLALGEVIDRENSRPLPPKYARLLPDTLLLVTLREDAAEALRPIAADLERELTDSCNRHGSLYDRSYRVELQRTDDPDAPLYAVAVHAGREGPAVEGQEPSVERSHATPDPIPPAVQQPSAPVPGASPRLDTGERFEGGRWVLIVEGDAGEDREAFRIGESLVTVGRGSDDASIRPSIAISDAPHVSRRQLALQWSDRDGAPGFTIYNLGLNDVHLPGQVVKGARMGRGALDTGAVPPASTGWIPPGVPARIGEHGPTLRIEEVPPDPEEVWVDPDATVFD